MGNVGQRGRGSTGRVSADYHDLAEWQAAVELVEQVYRLADGIGSGAGARVADALIRAATPIPAQVARAAAGAEGGLSSAETALLETETLLLVAVRLKQLGEGRAAPVLRRIETLVDSLQNFAPVVAIPTPASVPAPSPTPATPVSEAPSTTPEPAGATTAPAAKRAGVEPVTPSAPTDRLVVDGCNFLGCAAGFELGDNTSRDRLLFRLQEYARAHPAHGVTVVFDGQRASRKITAGVDERVASGLRSADDVIVDFIRELPKAERNRCTVITNDRDLALRVRKEGARVEPVRWLTSRFERNSPFAQRTKAQGLSSREVDEWEDFFQQSPKRPGR